MTDDQQSTSRTPAPVAETSIEKVVSLPSPPAPLPTIPTKNGFEIHRERMADRQAKLDHHRQSAEAGLAKLQEQLHTLVDEEKRLAVWEKMRVFQAQLGTIAEEQASLDQQKESLAQKEQQALTEQYRQSLKTAQIEGMVVAGKIRDLVLRGLAPLLREFDRWGEQDRLARNNLLVPPRFEPGTGLRIAGQVNTDEPHFSWATAIDGTVREAITEVIAQAQRSEAELQKRQKANA